MQMTTTDPTKKEIRFGRLKKAYKGAVVSVMALITALMFSVPAFAAGSLDNSTIVTGTKKLIADITSWLMVLAPVVTVMLVIYFCIRRSAADEMDQKKWNNRIVVAVVSCIGAVLASALINLIIDYYS